MFQVLHILTDIFYYLSFDYNHSSECKVVSHQGFDLPFLMTNNVEYLFVC